VLHFHPFKCSPSGVVFSTPASVAIVISGSLAKSMVLYLTPSACLFIDFLHFRAVLSTVRFPVVLCVQ
jgi:hypothetical protein